MEKDNIMEKRDFSQNCDKNDENLNNPCWKCNRFLFPIGCMVGEDDEEEEINNEIMAYRIN